MNRQPGRLLVGPGMAGYIPYSAKGMYTDTEGNFKTKTFCEIMSKEYKNCIDKNNYVICDYIREILVANGCIK